MNIEKWIDTNLTDLTNKVVVVTGATGVIAGFVCKGLLKKNAEVVFCYRNFNSATQKQQDLLNEFPNAKVKLQQLDLASKESVDDFCERLNTEYSEGIDCFINLAGCFNVPKSTTELGYDMLFQTNAIMPIYLMEKLQSLVKLKQGRFVNVSSVSYDFIRGFDEEDFQALNSGAIKRYANSKRFLTLYSFNKSQQLIDSKSDVSVVLCHPGICATNIIHYKNGGFSKGFYNVANAFMKVIFPSPQKTALCILKAVCMPPPESLCMVSPATGVYGYPKVKKVRLDSDKIEDMNFVIKKAEEILKSL